jgi:S-adenosylhomocysteine hydrolase
MQKVKMPGLMAFKEEYAGKSPLKGAKNYWMSAYDYSDSCIN